MKLTTLAVAVFVAVASAGGAIAPNVKNDAALSKTGYEICAICENHFDHCMKGCSVQDLNCYLGCRAETCKKGPLRCNKGGKCGKNYCSKAESETRAVDFEAPVAPASVPEDAGHLCDACVEHYNSCTKWCPGGVVRCLKECKKNTCKNGPLLCHKGKLCGVSPCSESLNEREDELASASLASSEGSSALPASPKNSPAETEEAESARGPPPVHRGCEKCTQFYDNCIKWCPPGMISCLKECKTATCYDGPQQCRDRRTCPWACKEGWKRTEEEEEKEEEKEEEEEEEEEEAIPATTKHIDTALTQNRPPPMDPCTPCKDHYAKCARWCPSGMINCLKECRRDTCRNGLDICHSGGKCSDWSCREG
ncbi:hypothetical protein GQ43DRAFT_493248 [Delitschia confertaspora ATCC 74209]|uniref:Uncharacterized protein n=1 Tax=Delitschia confertaspora ATCC 74209 TaxID=1513339 RepID=A0A9P4JSV1_9PLEO|nr:hypothetical protein GQ43DRAFT_493248 [Delitschia confertaspora ATCC 74209]